MKKRLLFFLFSSFLSLFAAAQDSCGLRISLLTCAPGAELYSTFGHTAIRVQDAAAGSDVVYNYGTFEFDEDFYMKFVRGKLLYALAAQSFDDFLYQYEVESRSVVAQYLNLSCAQKQRLHAALQQNLAPQHRSYRYDFLFDNCTTRARDMVDSGAGATVLFPNILAPESLTFRDHIDVYLLRGNQHWSKLGIDLLLGAKMDRPAANTEAMFLPDNLLKAFDGATASGQPLVTNTQTILNRPPAGNKPLLLSPVVAFSLVVLLFLALAFIKKGPAVSLFALLDFILFLLLGGVGVLLLFMWFGTDHALCANNYNLLWALPTHAVVAFFLGKNRSWVQRYFAIVFWLTALLLLAWAFLPQRMNSGFLPLVLLVAWRSWVHSKKMADGNKNN